MRYEGTIYSVTQINQYIKGLLDRDGTLSGVFVRGELSNYKMYPSGHHYFTLKDANGALRGVMFKREASSLRFRPQNGMNVIALGRVTVFPRDGQYQIYCTELTPDGVGDLHVAFEQLKEKLWQEGLFGSEHKQHLPRYPHRIALITSAAGAAVRDMIQILGARWPMSEVAVLPVRVQGVEAPKEICAAIAWANRHQVADLIIIGRGGGSMEDLWAFNDEQVARSICASQIPIISAVGHEPDITIADYVADLRAATPSNAAELAVPDQNDIYTHLTQLEERMVRSFLRKVSTERMTLERCTTSRALTNPMYSIEERRVLLDFQRDRLARGLATTLAGEKTRFARFAATLDALSPLKVLGRGYAIPRTEEGAVIKSVRWITSGDKIQLYMEDGKIHCQVLETQQAEKKRKG